MPSYAVTGAGRGIGLEYVRQLSDNSSNVVFALVRNIDSIPHLNPLTDRANVHVIQADTTSSEQLAKAAEQVASITGGSLDVLIANAGGVSGSGTSLANPGITPEELSKELNDNFELNVTSVIFTNNAFLPLLRKGNEKKIVDISSGIGDAVFTESTEFAHLAPYGIAKAALNFVVSKYAAELAKEKFTVIALSPGLVDTTPTKAGPPPSEEELKAFASFRAQWKKGQPEWNGNPLTVQDSVLKQLKVIKSVGPKDSGRFLSQNGNQQWF